jgi:predicted RNA-binding Zn-ribbon protein involved in translation (DUF1610 family)
VSDAGKHRRREDRAQAAAAAGARPLAEIDLGIFVAIDCPRCGRHGRYQVRSERFLGALVKCEGCETVIELADAGPVEWRPGGA